MWTDDTPMLGAYALVEEIGRGGMGVIYRAVHRRTHEVVALKTVLPQYEDCPETLARFQREAETAQSFNHPHSMPVLEVGSSERSIPFFTMPLASGGGLHHLLAKYRRRWRQIAELMAKVARAVHHAHSRGVLHRDIKPGNILFTEDHEPLVTDFGLAKPLTGSDDLTRSYAMLGTPSYVAPEQAAGKPRELTAAADIYSLGAVFYELLTGRPPFVGDNPLSVLQQIGKKPPVHPRRLDPAVPAALANISLRCLERHPSDRYASARDFADDLERWLNGGKIVRRSVRTRAWSVIQRRFGSRLWIGVLTGLIVLACVVGLSVGYWSRPSGPTTTIAVVIENLEQSPELERVVGQTTAELERAITTTPLLHLRNAEENHARSASNELNSLAYGRAVDAQAVLTGCIRRLDGRARLVTSLLRCDTGDVVWRHIDQIPLDQMSKVLPRVADTLVGSLPAAWRKNHDQSNATAQSSPSNAQAFYTRALELVTRRTHADLNTAATLLKKACDADPKFTPARAMLSLTLWTLARAYREHDQLQPAIRAAQETLAIDENSAQAHRVLAICLLDEARYPEALAGFWRAVELCPQSAGCCESLGTCLRRMGRPRESIRWFERAMKLAPAHGESAGCLGEAWAFCGRDDLAESAFGHAIELDGDTPNILNSLGVLRTWQGRFREARQLKEQVRVGFPDNQWYLKLAAWIEFCDGNAPEARNYYQQLRTADSYAQDCEFYGAVNPSSALACLAERAGELEQAHVLAEEALRIDLGLLERSPHNQAILHDLAATHSVLGDADGALDYLERAVAAGWVEHRSTRIDPRFSKILSLPRCQQLLDTMARRCAE